MVIRRGALSIVCLALTTCGLLFATAGTAEARVFSTTSSFGFFGGSPDAFLGQVQSNNNRCRAARMVKVFRENGRNDRLMGRDRANATGQWEINIANVPSARYYALIPKKKFGPNGRNLCRKYKSSTLSFGG